MSFGLDDVAYMHALASLLPRRRVNRAYHILFDLEPFRLFFGVVELFILLGTRG